ncbi:MAG: GIY-YIG nuclease family protein [Ktedonobacteraceae bacterium]
MSKSKSRSKSKSNAPGEIAAIRKEIEKCLNTQDESGRRVGDAAYGVYAFYDYDGEPIYVGQTAEKLRTRIRRHLTNQRTDAVAMNVLDPFEVYTIEMWPFWNLASSEMSQKKRQIILNRAEYTVYHKVLDQSELKAVLNEKAIPKGEPIDLPSSYRCSIVPIDIYQLRKHPDIRIARRTSTIANLARVISEREVSPGLRRALLSQARRLEHLAKQRLMQIDPTLLGELTEENDLLNDEEE